MMRRDQSVNGLNNARAGNGALVTDGAHPLAQARSTDYMAEKLIRVVTRANDGTFRTREYASCDELTSTYEQVGIDDCSTDLSLRGLPVFRGLIGPIPEGKQVARYETPDVFESFTKEWSKVKSRRRRRRPFEAAGGRSIQLVESTVPLSDVGSSETPLSD